MKTDGSIRVDTKIETNEAKADLKKLEKDLEKSGKKLESISQKTKSVFAGKTGMDKIANDCENATAKLKEVGEAAKSAFTGMSTKELEATLNKARKELEKTEAKLTELEGKIEKERALWDFDPKEPVAVDENGVKSYMTDEQIEVQSQMAEQRLDPLLRQREELRHKLLDEKEQVDSINEKLEKQLQAEQALSDEINKQKQIQAELKTSGKEAATDASWLNRIETQKQYNRALADTKVQMAAIEQQAERVSAKTGIPTSELLEQDAAYQKLAHRLEELEKHQNDYQDEVKQSTRQTKKMGDEGEKAGRKTEKGLRKAADSSKHMNTNLKRGIKKLGKMALACLAVEGAFTAVRRAATTYLEDNEKLSQQISSIWYVAGQAFGPFIESFVQGLSTVIVWVNSLVKALTGVDLIAKANAAALKKQASATKETANEAKKASRQLAGFDEMNKLTDDSQNANGTDSSAAIFDTSMAGDIPDFFEEIKKKILEGDWFGAGKTLGEEFTKWLEDYDWFQLGKDIGEAIVDGVQFALGFVLNVDPETLIGAVNKFLAGLLTAIAEGIQELDWQEIGGDILEALLGAVAAAVLVTDPIGGLILTLLMPGSSDLVKAASELIGSLLGAIVGVIAGMGKRMSVIGNKIGASIAKGVEKAKEIKESGGSLWESFCEGLKEAIADIKTWIKENLKDPFIKGFKNAFGIKGDESEESKKEGEAISKGLKIGIGNLWDKTGGKFTEWKSKISNWFVSKKEDFNKWGAYITTNFRSGLGDIWSKVSDKFTSAKTKITEWANSLKSKGENAGSKFTSGLQTGLNTLKNKLKDPINSLISMVERAINWIIDKMNKLSWKIPDWVPSIGGNRFGFNISRISIPRLERGGIVNNPGKGVPIIAGEAGKEAILPLQNHTEWMDILADKINAGVQKIVIPIYLHGTKIAEKIIEISNQRNFATNGAL